MTDTQIRAISAGFLHAMQTSEDLFNEWSGAQQNPTEIGPLIQRTMGLASAPDEADLQAMAQYIDDHLNDQLQALHTQRPSVPSHCGLIFGVQQK